MTTGYELSPLQRRLLVTRPDARDRRLSVAWITTTGPDDFAAALTEVCSKHELLRSRLVQPTGSPVPLQVPGPPPFVDRSPDAQPDAFADPPQLSLTTRQTGGQWCHELTADALLLDPGCVELLTREIDAWLSHDPPQSEALEHSMMAEWLAEFPASDEGRRAAAYWADAPRPDQASTQADPGPLLHRRVSAPDHFLDDVVKLATELGAQTRDLVLTAYLLAVAQLTGGSGASVGVFVDGRLDEELRNLMGPIGRFVPVETEALRGTSVADLVRDVVWRRELAEQHAEAYQAPADAMPTWGLVHVDLPAARQLAAVDVVWSGERARTTLMVLTSADGLVVDAVVPEAQAGADQLVDGVLRVLSQLVRRWGELDVVEVNALDVDEGGLVAEEPARPGTPASVLDLFDTAVTVRGAETAFLTGGVPTTYAELDERAGDYAAHLVSAGVTTGDSVLIRMRRGPDFAAALVGCWRMGAVVVPVDPQVPASRVELIRHDSGAVLDLTDPVSVAAPDDRATAVAGRVRPRIAYCIYTSGSTGRPKGVVVSHEALAVHIAGLAHELGLTTEDRTAFTASTGFDVSLEQVCLPWVAGGAVVPQQLDVATPDDLTALFDTAGVTHTSLAPTVWRLLARSWEREGWSAPKSLRLVQLGAERVLPVDLELGFAVAPGVQFANSYGPTETVVTATNSWLSPDRNPGTIGWPIAGRGVAVVDPRLNPVPLGVVGQLVVWGPAVADGYRSSPELTRSARALPSWLAARGVTEEAWLTGDYVHLTEHGLVYDGRRDRQVKVRGQRVELDEIELVLAEEAGGAQVAVTVSPSAGSVVAAVAATAIDDGLRARLMGRLPAYMVPQHLVAVPRLPRLANGKTDYAAVATLEESHDDVTTPGTEMERRLAALWAEVLHARAIGRDSDFFELGGESLSAIVLVTRIREELRLETRVATLMRHSRLADFASVLEASCRVSPDDAKLAPGQDERSYTYLASHAQRRLWFVGQFVTDPSTYNAPMFLVVPRSLDADVVDDAWERIVDAHDALRTTYEERAGDVVAVVHEQSQVEVRHIDLRASVDPEAAVRRLSLADQENGFDITTGPIGRVTHFMTQTGSRLFVNLHHIATDLWSAAILVRAFVGVVERDEPVARPAFTCRDHAERERAAAAAGAWDRARTYLVGELSPPPAPLDLPVDLPRPEVQSFAGAELSMTWDADLARAVAAFARTRGLTSFMVLLCAYLIAIRRWTNQADIVVGFPVAGREDDDLRDVVGFFVATSFVRVDMAVVSTGDELVETVREKVLAAIEHQGYPFDTLVSAAELERTVDRPPVFSVMLAHQDLVPLTHEMSVAGWQLEELPDPVTKFELSLTTWVEDGRLQGSLSYCTDLFTAGRSREFGELFERCLQRLVGAA